jgi:predicted transposase YdaD
LPHCSFSAKILLKKPPWRERELIYGLDVEEDARADLLSIAATLGGRYFTGELLRRVFQEELEVLKTYGLVAELVEEGRQEGRQEGQLEGAQNTLLRLLRNRFGEIPETVDARVRSMDAEAVDALVDRAASASSLADLRLDH